MRLQTIIFLSVFYILTSCDSVSHADFDLKQLTIDSTKFLEQDSIITIQVTLINDLDTSKLPAYCGFRQITNQFYFKVVKTIKGKYDLPVLPIIISCPRELVESKGLQNDKIYTYTLKRTVPGQIFYSSITATDNLVYYILDNRK